MHPSRILALGVGNTLLTDEGAGPRAADRLAARAGDRPGLTCLDAGTLSFTLAEAIATADGLVIFDAARLGQAPGSVRLLEGAEMDEFVRSGKLTVHEVGITDLMDMARMTGDLPAHRALIAIEPGEIGWGLELSPDVARAIDPAVDLALRLLDRWAAAPAELSA
jgi:hydrogenase maturation protease